MSERRTESPDLIRNAVVRPEPEPPGTDYLLPVVHASLDDMKDFITFVKEKIEDKGLDVFGAVKVDKTCFCSA